MEKLDRFLSLLSYSRRIAFQLMDVRNLKYFHLIFRGFTPDKGHIYDFKKHGYRNYVTDSVRYMKTVFINYNNRDLLNDKYGCYLFLKQYTEKMLPVYALIDYGNFYLLNQHKSIDELLSREKKFILKPRKGRGGDGVMLLEVLNGNFYLNGRHILTFGDIFKGLMNYIVTPYIHQHEYAASIYPHTLNTIRLLTCIQDDRVRIIGVGHRFGGEATGCVDNFAAGGVSALIDLETGCLEESNQWDANKRKIRLIDKHPDTKQIINGLRVPFWNEIVRQMSELHYSIKFIKYIGWDIAITAENDFKIIEANYASDLEPLQIKAPLLADEDNKRFFSMYG